jgi:hypothetical protein
MMNYLILGKKVSTTDRAGRPGVGNQTQHGRLTRVTLGNLRDHQITNIKKTADQRA